MHILTGDEHFMFDGMPTNYLLNDFWAWQASDLLNNALRGILAEFIVAKALRIDTSEPRQEWDAFDLLFERQWKIEVKSSAYLQSWEQQGPSRIQFSIRPTRTWATDEKKRQSDLYIFCVYTTTDRAHANPLCLDQWDFYIMQTAQLDAYCGTQKTITLSSLLSLHPIHSDYGILHDKAKKILLEAEPIRNEQEIQKLSDSIAGHELLKQQS